jgi:secretion/DNA translocation related TadE-like protein
MTTERASGNVSVLMVAAVVLAGALCIVVARVGGVAADRARADTAADVAALAAADELAQHHGCTAATTAARRVATANGAAFDACSCDARGALVLVHIGRIRTRARAEVTERAGLSAFPHNS